MVKDELRAGPRGRAQLLPRRRSSTAIDKALRARDRARGRSRSRRGAATLLAPEPGARAGCRAPPIAARIARRTRKPRSRHGRRGDRADDAAADSQRRRRPMRRAPRAACSISSRACARSRIAKPLPARASAAADTEIAAASTAGRSRRDRGRSSKRAAARPSSRRSRSRRSRSAKERALGRRQSAGTPAAAPPRRAAAAEPDAHRLQAAGRRRRRQRRRRHAGRFPQFESRGSAVTTGITTGTTKPPPQAQRSPPSVLVTPIAEIAAHAAPSPAPPTATTAARIVTTGADGTPEDLGRDHRNSRAHHRARRRPGDRRWRSTASRALTGHANGKIVLWDLDRAEKIATVQRNEAERLGRRLHRRSRPLRRRQPRLEGHAVGCAPDRGAAAGARRPRERRAGRWPIRAAAAAARLGRRRQDGALWNLDTLDLKRTYRGHARFRDRGRLLAQRQAARRRGARRQHPGLVGASSRRLRALSGHRGRVADARLLAVGRPARLGRRRRHGALVGSAARTHRARAHRPRRRRHRGGVSRPTASIWLGRRRRARAPVGYSARTSWRGNSPPSRALGRPTAHSATFVCTACHARRRAAAAVSTRSSNRATMRGHQK